jgi:hypothetical protein
MLELLGHELFTNINSNELKTIIGMFLYWSFILFVASTQHENLLKRWISFQHIKSPNYTKLF